MTKFCVFISLMLYTLSINAQTIVKGRVLDAANNQPIPSAHLSIEGIHDGTATSANGTFELRADRFPVVITVSHLNYKTHTLTLTKSQKDVKVFLKQKTTELPATEIHAGKIQNLVKNKPLFVYDYAFYGDSLLLLTYPKCRQRNSSLILMTTEGKELLRQKVRGAEKLYKDAAGNVHLFTKDSTWQLFVDNDRVLLLYPASKDYFKNRLKSLKGKIEANYYVAGYRYKNQVLDYFRYDMQKEESFTFRTITHMEGVNMLHRDFYWRIQQKGFSEADLRFEEMAFYSPIFAPLLTFRDSVIIMNYVKDSIEVYNPQGKLFQKTPITFHKHKNWEEELIVDKKKKQVYALFSDGGLKSLRPVDMKTGQAGPKIPIPDFRFVENIKVHNNRLFFLYKDYLGQKYKKLYRMDI